MNYDVVVIGAGPGGYVSAIRAAQLGAKTAIVEKESIGGTCLNVGCIPTKALMKNVEIIHGLEVGAQRGITIDGELKLNYKRAVKAKNSAVRQLVKGVEGLLASNGVDVYKGMGTVKEGKVVSINSENETKEIGYEKLIIATGSAPAVPPIKGSDLEGVMTSNELLALESVPESMVIIGGGVIGCEFATILSAYGCKVTIVEMMPTLVSMLDNDISEYMEGIMQERGVELKLGKQVEEIKNTEDGMLSVSMKDDSGVETVKGNNVLISIGRKTNTDGLEVLDLDMVRGRITVDDKLETSKADVFAIGDVTGKKQLAHAAAS